VVWLLAAGWLTGAARGQDSGNLAAPTNNLNLAALTNHINLAALTNDFDLAKLTNDLKIRIWNETIDLRGTIGYKDNVTLSNTNRQGSPFRDAGADLTVFRLPTGHWIFSLFASADETTYFGGQAEPKEEVVIAGLQAMRQFPENWSSGFGLSYFYQHQILDLTAELTNQAAISQVTGNNFTGRWLTRKEFKTDWAQLDLSGGREVMAAPLDSFWQLGPRLGLGRRYGQGSEVNLTYQWNYMIYDTRQQVSRLGYALPGTSLRFTSQMVEINWHQAWDKARHWHTFLTAGDDLNNDNGPGYFNFSQYRLAPRIEYQGKTWKIGAFARAGYYFYPIQPASFGSSTLRERIWLSTGLHAEKQILKPLKIFAEYLFDRSSSDVETDTYYNDTVRMGFDWQF
jgi:hypothetical protein